MSMSTSETIWSRTPLHLASYLGYDELIKILLVHPYIKVNLRDGGGSTTFLLGCRYRRLSVIEVLLKDPRVNSTLGDKYGDPPLWHACCGGYPEVVERLIASGRDLGDLNLKWGEGKKCTVLEIAQKEHEHASGVTAGEIPDQPITDPSRIACEAWRSG